MAQRTACRAPHSPACQAAPVSLEPLNLLEVRLGSGRSPAGPCCVPFLPQEGVRGAINEPGVRTWFSSLGCPLLLTPRPNVGASARRWLLQPQSGVGGITCSPVQCKSRMLMVLKRRQDSKALEKLHDVSDSSGVEQLCRPSCSVAPKNATGIRCLTSHGAMQQRHGRSPTFQTMKELFSDSLSSHYSGKQVSPNKQQLPGLHS
nr:uncharacterized protein LOC110355670 [Columba livia]